MCSHGYLGAIDNFLIWQKVDFNLVVAECGGGHPQR